MRIRQPGKIREQLWLLGREESCTYILEGHHESMIINGGTSYLVPDLLGQLDSFGINETRITKLLILHSHFDHVGTVPFFKRRYPTIEVYASARSWDIFRMPKAIDTINAFSRSVAKRVGKEGVYASYDLEWRDDMMGKAVSEGDCIDVGGLEVQIIATPGHSSCSLSAYVPQLKALFASDAGGIPYKDMILALGNSNFTQFQHSLEKLKDLDVEYVCADHYGCVAGDEARNFIQQTIEVARQGRASLEMAYRRTGDIDSAAKELTADFYQNNPDYFLPPDIFEGVYRQAIRQLADAIEREKSSLQSAP